MRDKCDFKKTQPSKIIKVEPGSVGLNGRGLHFKPALQCMNSWV